MNDSNSVAFASIPRPQQLGPDILEAERLLQSHVRLSARLWAAYVAGMTGLHTYGVCWAWNAAAKGWRFSGFEVGYAGTPEAGKLQYHRPSEIARNIARRFDMPQQVWSREELVDAIMWLEDPEQREYALEGAGLLASARPFPDREEASSAVHRIRQLAHGLERKETRAEPAVLPEDPVLFRPTLIEQRGETLRDRQLVSEADGAAFLDAPARQAG